MSKQDNNFLIAISILMAILMISALAKLPYGYYTFLRIATLLSCTVFSWIHYTNGKNNYLALLFVLVGILFNPIISVHLPREIWAYINITVAIFYIVNIRFLRQLS